MPILTRYIDSDGRAHASPPSISVQNRAFRYGDGLFETMLVRGGRAVALHLHLDRLAAGAAALGLEPHGPSLRAQAAEVVDKLLKDQPAGGCGRIRLTAYRDDGGHYLPQQDKASLMGEVVPLAADPWTLRPPLRVAVAHAYPLVHSPLSGAKTLNALPYVLAARLARASGCDDALMRHEAGELAELTASNLFMVVGGRLLTPRLASACLPGTMRARVIAAAQALGIPVSQEGLYLPQLDQADEAFATNAIIGLQPIGEVTETRYRAAGFPVMTALREAAAG